MLRQHIKITIGILLVLSLNTLQAEFSEARGSILSANGRAITLSPVGGYIAKSKYISEDVGKKGLQKYYNDVLVSGTDVQTSIHGVLQSNIDRLLTDAKKKLQAKEVLAMVMNSKTGELIAIASSNRYDLLHISEKDIPSLNPKFAQYPYEPGAMMMPFTVAMLLNTHTEEPDKYKEWFNTD